MIRSAPLRGFAVAALAFAAAGCQYPLVLVVSNTTNAPVTISLRLFAPESDYCLPPRRLSYIPASQVGRRFGEPERTSAQGVEFDTSLCSVQAVLPPSVALELEFDPLVGFVFSEQDHDAEFTATGSAGTVIFRGSQLRRHLAERAGSLILEYGAA
jgi:hypothetical protein